jgi:hypothetical protein
MKPEGRYACVLTLVAASAAFAACGGGPEAPMAEPVPQRVDCEKAGGLCMPNTNAAPPRYRQANSLGLPSESKVKIHLACAGRILAPRSRCESGREASRANIVV